MVRDSGRKIVYGNELFKMLVFHLEKLNCFGFNKNETIEYAMATLALTKAACEDLAKLSNSAITNAENNHGMDKDFICYKVFISPGPTMKRIMPRAQDLTLVLKRTSHITMVLKEKRIIPNRR